MHEYTGLHVGQGGVMLNPTVLTTPRQCIWTYTIRYTYFKVDYRKNILVDYPEIIVGDLSNT